MKRLRLQLATCPDLAWLAQPQDTLGHTVPAGLGHTFMEDEGWGGGVMGGGWEHML